MSIHREFQVRPARQVAGGVISLVNAKNAIMDRQRSNALSKSLLRAHGVTMALVCEVDSRGLADVLVYEVDSRGAADLLVSLVDTRGMARNSDSIWCKVDSRGEASSRICWVDSRGIADLLICYVESRGEAGWRREHSLQGKL